MILRYPFTLNYCIIIQRLNYMVLQQLATWQTHFPDFFLLQSRQSI